MGLPHRRVLAVSVTVAQRPKSGQPLPAFIVRRAEASYRDAEEARKKAEAAAAVRMAEANARSIAQAEEAERALASPHRSLRLALDWFTHEWTASLPVRLHKADVAGDASPEWADRWKAWLMAHDEGWQPGEDVPPPFDPTRRAWLRLRRSSNLFDKFVAEYLFRLASLGFDMRAAARDMDPPIAVPYIPGYTEKAIDRLRERIEGERRKPARTVDRPEWMDRLNIGKSDAQHAAEEAA